MELFIKSYLQLDGRMDGYDWDWDNNVYFILRLNHPLICINGFRKPFIIYFIWAAKFINSEQFNLD